MGPNETAARAVVEALRALGRVELVDEARTVAFVQLACCVDDEPGSPGLWKQYRDAELTLRGTDGGDDALEGLLASLRDSA